MVFHCLLISTSLRNLYISLERIKKKTFSFKNKVFIVSHYLSLCMCFCSLFDFISLLCVCLCLNMFVRYMLFVCLFVLCALTPPVCGLSLYSVKSDLLKKEYLLNAVALLTI